MKAIVLSVPFALLIGVSSAQAVQFNPDAMRAMQQQGNQMAAQILNPRPYVLPSGKCLTLTGEPNVLPANIAIDNCNGSPAQSWKFDPQSRLVNQGGACAVVEGDPAQADVNVRAEPCGGDARFVWQPRADGRLVHKGGKCLSVLGDPGAPGSNVGVAGCGNDATQVWR